MSHDARDVETMARLLCGIMQCDPDKIDEDGAPAWYSWEAWGDKALDALQAKGWKITAQPFECPLPVDDTDPQPEYCPLCHAHIDRDACRIDHMARGLPICPRNGQ